MLSKLQLCFQGWCQVALKSRFLVFTCFSGFPLELKSHKSVNAFLRSLFICHSIFFTKQQCSITTITALNSCRCSSSVGLLRFFWINKLYDANPRLHKVIKYCMQLWKIKLKLELVTIKGLEAQKPSGLSWDV